MKYATQMLFVNAIEDVSSDEEIDELFSQLLHIEPPATLVADILASVAHLPLPQAMDTLLLDDVEGLIARTLQSYS